MLLCRLLEKARVRRGLFPCLHQELEATPSYMISAIYIRLEVSIIWKSHDYALLFYLINFPFALIFFILSAVDNVKPVTHILIVNISTRKGIDLLREGIQYLVFFFL